MFERFHPQKQVSQSASSFHKEFYDDSYKVERKLAIFSIQNGPLKAFLVLQASGRLLGPPRLLGRNPISIQPVSKAGLTLWTLHELGTNRQKLPGYLWGSLSFSPRLHERGFFELQKKRDDEVKGSTN